MKKKIKVLALIIIMISLTACTKNNTAGTKVDKTTDTSNLKGKLICSRTGEGLNNSSVGLDYEVEYRNGYITKMHSIEKVSTSNQDVLDQYEEAYKKIFSAYKDVKYYTNKITRSEIEVVSDTTIEYDKVDMNKIIAIEGNNQGLYVNGKLDLSKWLDFAEQVGTSCYEE